MTKDKLDEILGGLILFGPIILFFFVKWYWVVLLYNLIFSIFGYITWLASKKKPMGLFKAIALPLLFNFIGLLYFIYTNDPENKDAEEKTVVNQVKSSQILYEKIDTLYDYNNINFVNKPIDILNLDVENLELYISYKYVHSGSVFQCKKSEENEEAEKISVFNELEHIRENSTGQEEENFDETNQVFDGYSYSIWLSKVKSTEFGRLLKDKVQEWVDSVEGAEYLSYQDFMLWAGYDEWGVHIMEGFFKEIGGDVNDLEMILDEVNIDEKNNLIKWYSYDQLENEYYQIGYVLKSDETESKKDEKIRKFSEFKKAIKSKLNSKEKIDIEFYMYKYDVIEKLETYGENWRGIDYTLSWDEFIKNAIFSFDEGITDFYEIIKDFSSLDELDVDVFNLDFIADDGGSPENFKVVWQRELSDEESKQFEEYGGVNQLHTDSDGGDSIDMILGRISSIVVKIGDNENIKISAF